MTPFAVNQTSLRSFGAGDLVDGAVRLYRQHFGVLVRVAALPVVVSVVGGVLWAIGVRGVPRTPSGVWLVVYVVVAVVGLVLSLGGRLLLLVVMGGAARNLVSHLVWGEAVTVGATYRYVRARFWALLGATLMVCVLVGVVLFGWGIIVSLVVAGAVGLGRAAAVWLAAAAGVITTTVFTGAALWLFFLVAGRLAYVPQVLAVEDRDVGGALQRSAVLARGNVWPVATVVLFNVFAYYAALALLLTPLGWYAYMHGVNPLAFGGVNQPVWYVVAVRVLTQVAAVLLAPLWMLCLSLLYVDGRVRHEGFDIELMAARTFGPISNHATVGAAQSRAVNSAAASPVAGLPEPENAPAWSPGSTLNLR